MTSTKALLDSILSDVKRHSFLTDDELLERRQLSTAILDNFKSWISSVVNQEEEEEEQENSNNSIKNDIETVGSACLQIVQMRLSTAQKKTSDDDDEEAQSFYANDATLRLVIDCVELFVTSSSILKIYDFSSSSSWKQLLIFLCTRTSPLEISLRGFELLVKFVLTKINLSKESSSSPSAVSSSGDISSLMRNCIGSADDNDSEEAPQGTLSVRLASTLHEKFSTSSNRKFCVASNFHTILQEEIFLPNYFSKKNIDDDNEDDNKKTSVVARSPLFLDAKTGKRDYLSLAVVFTSIAQVIRACGPQHLHPRVAEVFASYLATAAQSSSSTTLSCNIDFMEGEVLRPFVYQSIEEMFQRGTQHDEEVQTTHGDGADEEEGKSTKMVVKTSPWSDYVIVVLSDDEKINYEGVNIIAKSLISVMASITRNQLSSDEIELWIRAVSGFISSALGMQKMINNLSSSSSSVDETNKTSDENKNENQQHESSSSSSGFMKFLRIFSSIVSQMIRTASSTGTIASKVIGLNAIQSTAVPLSHDLTRLVKKIYSDFKNDSIVHERDITTFQLIVSQSVTFLKNLLHFTTSENNNNNQQQTSISHFASSLFPLHRNASSSNNIGYSDDKVSDAFWSMIEQVVVAPPFVDVQKLSQMIMGTDGGGDEQNNSSTPSSSLLLLRNEVINFFIQNFADPILSPMTPSLISLLSTTSQKELGLDLYQRRKSLAMALLRVEQLFTTTTNSSSTNRALVGGCSKIMWTKLRNSVLIAGGGQT